MNRLQLIRNTPKAELHMHLEGSLEPAMMIKLAKKNGVKLPFETEEEISSLYNFSNLQSFLDIYHHGTSVLQTSEDFYEMAMAYYARAHEDGIVTAEIFFDFQTHLARGMEAGTIMDGLNAAKKEALKTFGIKSGFIMCFLRHLCEETAFENLNTAMKYKDDILGIGLASSEAGNPPTKFKRVFEKAKNEGFRLVAHAGEEGPPEYIWQAINDLKVERIDHGVRCLEDNNLVSYLKEHQIPLTVCPLSNIKLKVFQDMKEHPIKKMLELGLNVCINSDDPAYFGGYLVENFIAIDNALSLSEDEIKTLCQNSLQSSFIAPPLNNVIRILTKLTHNETIQEATKAPHQDRHLRGKALL